VEQGLADVDQALRVQLRKARRCPCAARGPVHAARRDDHRVAGPQDVAVPAQRSDELDLRDSGDVGVLGVHHVDLLGGRALDDLAELAQGPRF
jgi:hypothetical protein